MSKFLKSMIVLLAIVAMATPVMAEDMLSLGGQMRVRGNTWDDGGDTTKSWADQRMRIGGKLSVAEGVSITFRFDATERAWGSGGNTYGAGRMPQDAMQWDRAHIDLAFDGFSLRAGQQYIGVGAQGGTFNAQDAGIKLAFNGPVSAVVFGMLADAHSTDTDGFYYGASVGFGGDAFKVNVFGAAQNKVQNADEDVYLAGADVTLNFDVIKILAEVDFFTGDASATSDAFGTQLSVDASLNAGESLTFGGQAWYALGDTDDTQFAVLGNDFNGYDPLFAVGSGLENGPFGATRPQEFFGNNSGVMAGRLYTSIKLGDALKLGASVAYLQPEEDANVTADSALVGAFGLKYALMSNTSIGALIEYIDIDDVDTDAAMGASVGLFVNF